jgi:sarcosine oxidase subunit gamma
VALVFRRSFAEYIWRLIERTAQPYGLQVAEARACPDSLLTPLLEGGAQAQRSRLQPA